MSKWFDADMRAAGEVSGVGMIARLTLGLALTACPPVAKRRARDLRRVLGLTLAAWLMAGLALALL